MMTIDQTKLSDIVAEIRAGETEASLPTGLMLTPRSFHYAHFFGSTREAYDASQTYDSIKDGDLLIVPSEQVIGIVVLAWPVAYTNESGSFHHPDEYSELVAAAVADGELPEAEGQVIINGRYVQPYAFAEAIDEAMGWYCRASLACTPQQYQRYLDAVAVLSGPGAPDHDTRDQEGDGSVDAILDLLRPVDQDEVARRSQLLSTAALAWASEPREQAMEKVNAYANSVGLLSREAIEDVQERLVELADEAMVGAISERVVNHTTHYFDSLRKFAQLAGLSMQDADKAVVEEIRKQSPTFQAAELIFPGEEITEVMPVVEDSPERHVGWGLLIVIFFAGLISGSIFGLAAERVIFTAIHWVLGAELDAYFHLVNLL